MSILLSFVLLGSPGFDILEPTLSPLYSAHAPAHIDYAISSLPKDARAHVRFAVRQWQTLRPRKPVPASTLRVWALQRGSEWQLWFARTENGQITQETRLSLSPGWFQGPAKLRPVLDPGPALDFDVCDGHIFVLGLKQLRIHRLDTPDRLKDTIDLAAPSMRLPTGRITCLEKGFVALGFYGGTQNFIYDTELGKAVAPLPGVPEHYDGASLWLAQARHRELRRWNGINQARPMPGPAATTAPRAPNPSPVHDWNALLSTIWNSQASPLLVPGIALRSRALSKERTLILSWFPDREAFRIFERRVR